MAGTLTKLESNGRLPQQKRFVAVWAGDTKDAAEKIGVSYDTALAWTNSAWFAEAIDVRTAREISQHRRDKARSLAEDVLSRTEIQAYWSGVIEDEYQKMADRLKASELLAKTLGMFIEKVEVTTGPPPPSAKTIDLADRLALLGVKVTDAIVAPEAPAEEPEKDELAEVLAIFKGVKGSDIEGDWL